MLGIRRIGAGRADYYLSDLATEVPVPGSPSPSPSLPGRWVGAAAPGLGLSEATAVEPSRFRSLLSGRPPPLRGGRQVAGYDLTFSAPKSVSVVFGLGGDDMARQVVAAHEEAVGGALRYLEQHGLGAVRRSGEDRARGERRVIATSGFAGAMFTHGVSRNLDPHVHSHVVVINAVHGADGRWSALDGRGLDAHRRAAAGVYEANLRHALTATLGVRWDAPGAPDRSPEIVGVPAPVLGEFSSRGADVRMDADRAGARSARGRHVAWAATRPPKVTGIPYDELAVEWRRRARFAGPTLELDRRSGRSQAAASYDEHRFAGVIALTPHGGAHRRDAVEAFAASARDGVPAASLDQVAGLWVPDQRLGVAEDLMPRRSVVPENRHLQVLGPRPVNPAQHEVWLTAARAMDAYRERWGIERATAPLGDAPSLASLPAARLADHLRVTRQLDAARVQLGRRAAAEVELGLDR